MKITDFEFLLKNDKNIFFQDEEITVLDYEKTFNIAFVKLTNSDKTFAIDIMALFCEPQNTEIGVRIPDYERRVI